MNVSDENGGANSTTFIPGKPRRRIWLVAVAVALGVLAGYVILSILPADPATRHAPTTAEIRAAVLTCLETCAPQIARVGPMLYIRESEHVPGDVESLGRIPVEIIPLGEFIRRFQGDPGRPMLVRVEVKCAGMRDEIDPEITVCVHVGDPAFSKEEPWSRRHGQSYGYTFRCLDDGLETVPSNTLVMTE
jgi:hypothetical protein